MATKYISSITLPNGDEARLVDKYSGYTTNTGTVTSVTASGVLSSSGGTTPAITHNAPSTSPTKSTQAVYPITIDSYGHITSAGNAASIPEGADEIQYSPSSFDLQQTWEDMPSSQLVAPTNVEKALDILALDTLKSNHISNTYNSSDMYNPISGKGVEDALQTLDSSISATTGQAISAITITDGKISSSSKISVGDANQNAWSNIKVGNTTINSASTTGTFELEAGTNITLTPDNTNKKITIATNGSGGIEAFPVTLTEGLEGDYYLDKSFQDIKTAYNAGKYIYLNVYGDIYNLVGYDEFTFYFSNTKVNGNNTITVDTYLSEDDDTVENIISTINTTTSYGLEEFTDWYSKSGTYNANNAPLGTIRTRTSYVTSNLPSGVGNFGFLFTTGTTNTSGSSSYRIQTYYDTSTNGITGVYTRFLSGGTWYPWVLIGPASYTDANNISY